MKNIIIGLIILMYLVPFTYIMIADAADILKRIHEGFSLKVKPALIVLSRMIID